MQNYEDQLVDAINVITEHGYQVSAGADAPTPGYWVTGTTMPQRRTLDAEIIELARKLEVQRALDEMELSLDIASEVLPPVHRPRHELYAAFGKSSPVIGQ